MENGLRTGTAGRTIPALGRDRFASEGSQLQRHPRRFQRVKINSSLLAAPPSNRAQCATSDSSSA
jgi:hypothetical protein